MASSRQSIHDFLCGTNPPGYDTAGNLLLPAPPTGIEDDIAIINSPTILNQDEEVTFTGIFIDEGEPTTIGGIWDWELNARHEGGTQNLVSGTSSWDPGTNNTTWTITVPDLNNWTHEWIWNTDGRVSAFVTAQAIDSDNVLHTDQLEVGINQVPNTPSNLEITISGQSLELSWFSAGGAANYNVYRDNEAYSALAEMSLLAGTPQLTYTDSDNPVGNIDVSYYYVVTGSIQRANRALPIASVRRIIK